MNTDVLSVFFIVLLGLGGFFVLVGLWSDDKKCTGCNRLGPSEYMSKDSRGRYWHYSCYKDGYFFE